MDLLCVGAIYGAAFCGIAAFLCICEIVIEKVFNRIEKLKRSTARNCKGAVFPNHDKASKSNLIH